MEKALNNNIRVILGLDLGVGSIITVTYNAESTLPPTLESVREQTCSLYEYIVMDGVSKDKTLKLHMEKALNNNIRVILGLDLGVGSIGWALIEVDEADRRRIPSAFANICKHYYLCKFNRY